MSIDVMIVGPAEDIARPTSLEIMDWLFDRWQAYEIPYGFIELDESEIQELETRFSDDPVAQILLKKVNAAKQYVESNGHQLDWPYAVELMISY